MFFQSELVEIQKVFLAKTFCHHCASCTLWVCILCTPPVELSALRSGNPKPHALTEKLKKNHPLSSSDFEQCHHQEFQVCHEELCHDEDDEDEVCGRSPCCSFFHLPINNIVIFFTSFNLLIRILTSLFTWVDGCTELLRFCHEFVL